MNSTIFLQLALVLSLASILGFVVKQLKLPLLVAYLFVGIFLSSLVPLIAPISLITPIFPQIGIAFVLFLIGMELDLNDLTSLGRPILVSGLLQIIISGLAGFVFSNLFGFKGLEAIYLGVGLSFSSTIVVVKLLLERKDLTSLYGKLSMGVLLLEDIVAIAILMFLSFSGTLLNLRLENSLPLLILIAKGIFIISLAYFLSRFVLSQIFKAVAKSTELLFLTALTWCFAFTSIALLLNFSIVVGAFLAGLALARSPFHYHISGRIKPIRDFFLILFFVYLGSQVNLSKAALNLPIILVFSFYAMFVKPLIFLLIFGAFGFRKHTIFQAALNLSQISEFGLIILLVGVSLGLVSQNSLSIIALTTAISITGSSILISRSKELYPLVKPLLNFFETKDKFHKLEDRTDRQLEDHVVVIGAHRIGGPIIKFLNQQKIPHVVLDFNPVIVEKLLKEGIVVFYGDLGDPEVLENLKLDKAKLVISTSSSLEDNKLLLSTLKRKKVQAKIVIRAAEFEDLKELKAKGADYVIFPEDVSADFLVTQLKTHWPQINFATLNS